MHFERLENPTGLSHEKKKTLKHSVFEGCNVQHVSVTVVAKNGGMWLEHNLGNKL